LEKFQDEAKNLRQELREREREIQFICETFPGITFKSDINGIFLSSCGNVEEISGYPRDEFCNGRFGLHDLIHPQDLPQLLVDVEKLGAASGRFFKRRHRILRKDGQVLWVHSHMGNCCDDAGNPVSLRGAIYNISEYMLIKDALEASEERLELAISGSKAGVWDVELSTDASGALSGALYISPVFKQFIGFDDDEFPNTLIAWRSLVDPQDLEKVVETAVHVLEGLADEHDVEYRMRHKDGAIRWIHSRGRIRRDHDGRVIRWTGLNWDVTERRNAEEHLKRLVAILEQTPDIIGTAGVKGNILYFNKAARETFGIAEKTDLFEHNILQFYPRWTNDLLCKEIIPTSLKWGVWRGENTILSAGGQEIPVSQVVLSHKDATGKAQYLSTIVRDISRLRETESALRNSEERYRHLAENLEIMVKEQVAKLRQAESMAAIGQMMSVVAHEIRNPLNNITLGVDTLQVLLQDQERLEVCAEIQYGVTILRKIFEELLDYSRPVKLIYSVCSLNDVIKDALKRIPAISPAVSLEIETEEGDRQVILDPEKIARVLVNLLSNAMDAMPGGGILKIFSSRCSGNAQESVLLRVSDTGAGMDEETLERILTPFFSTKPRGTGLGLPICSKIVEAHNGKMTVTSKPGEGTTVEIVLPATPATI